MASEQINAALWGFGGALIYAGPRFSACLFAPHDDGQLRCAFEFLMALVVGTIAAVAFGSFVVGIAGVKHYVNAVSAMVGLIANPTAPRITDALSSLVVNLINGEFLKLPKKDGKP